MIPRGSIIVNAAPFRSFRSDLAKMAHRAASCTMWRCGNQLAAVRLGVPIDARAFADGTRHARRAPRRHGRDRRREGLVARDVWDLIRLLPEILSSDIGETALQPPIVAALDRSTPPSHATVLGDAPGPDPSARRGRRRRTQIDPHVVFDATRRSDSRQRGSAHSRVHADQRAVLRRSATCSVMGGEISVLLDRRRLQGSR